MAITPLGGAGPSNIAGAGSPQKTESFGKMMKGQAKLENASIPVNNPPTTQAKSVQQASAGKCRAEGTKQISSVDTKQVTATKVLDQVNAAQNRMEQLLKVAESGKSFSPAELLSLQTHVYRASQELDLAGKVVEKATGGIKQVLQTQV